MPQQPLIVTPSFWRVGTCVLGLAAARLRTRAAAPETSMSRHGLGGSCCCNLILQTPWLTRRTKCERNAWGTAYAAFFTNLRAQNGTSAAGLHAAGMCSTVWQTTTEGTWWMGTSRRRRRCRRCSSSGVATGPCEDDLAMHCPKCHDNTTCVHIELKLNVFPLPGCQEIALSKRRVMQAQSYSPWLHSPINAR